MSKAIKPDHNGAKNGGGYWGKRAWAKMVTPSLRRRADKAAIEEDLPAPMADCCADSGCCDELDADLAMHDQMGWTTFEVDDD